MRFLNTYALYPPGFRNEEINLFSNIWIVLVVINVICQLFFLFSPYQHEFHCFKRTLEYVYFIFSAKITSK